MVETKEAAHLSRMVMLHMLWRAHIGVSAFRARSPSRNAEYNVDQPGGGRRRVGALTLLIQHASGNVYAFARVPVDGDPSVLGHSH